MQTVGVKEAATILGLDPRSVRYAITQGRLAARTENGPTGPRYTIALTEVLDYQRRRTRRAKRFKPSIE